MRPRFFSNALAVFACFVLLQSTIFAQGQTGGSIGGVVRDSTGAVLPGVTVEAASPALIEKVRTGVTDSEGIYRIVDLRPGVYAISFTLPGFTTLRREGIELTAGVTATFNAELRVGAVEETVTVSGQSPVVDVQSTTQHRSMTTTLIEDLPTGKTPSNLAVLIPGIVSANQDVGGNSRHGSQPLSIHGSRSAEMPMIYDGMRYAAVWGQGGGSSGVWVANAGMVEEFAIDTAGAIADAEVSGVRINIIPKQGGNRFSGYFLGNFANDTLQSDNLDDELRARGAGTPTVTKKVWDINPAMGGPIKRDRLWFYASFRHNGITEQPTGLYYDTNPNDFVFVQDLSRPAPVNGQWTHSTNLRLTYQTSPNSKLMVYGDHPPRGRFGDTALAGRGNVAWEATTRFESPVNNLFQATWNWTVSDRLLIEVGQTYRPEQWAYGQQPEVPWDYSGAIEGRTGVGFRAPTNRIEFDGHQNNGKFVVSYVTGSHHLKVGSQWFMGSRTQFRFTNNDSWVNLLDGVPVSLTLRTTPIAATDSLKANLGLYAQEQLTVKRLTLNLGMRFDYLNAYVAEQHAPAVRYAPARDFAAIENLPNWKDVSPRLGASYDLFGNAKTALKFNVGRYLEGQAVGIAEVVNPLLAPAGATGTRAWNDRNGDFIPQEEELGPIDNTNFGKAIVTTRYAPQTVTGWGRRGWNWEALGGILHELRPGLAVEATYHRRWYGNFRLTDNVLVAPADYDQYCVTAPVDPRLPGGGGQQVCGLYDITPTKFGINDNVVTLAKNFGKQSDIYDGLDFNVNLRLAGGVTFQGGTNTGRTATNSCFVVDSPQALRFCDVSPPFLTQVKLLGIYPLPWWGLQTSATYQSLPGPEIAASWAASAAAVTGLGRSLAGGVRSVTVPLVEPGTMYGNRLHQVDVRLSRTFRVIGARWQGLFDIYNALNANPVLTQNNTYGSTWQRPLAILPGRMFKFGVQLDF